MSAKAVVFDYFGTLQVAVPDPELQAQRGRVGAALGAHPDRFATAFAALYDARFCGQTGDLAQTLTDVASSVGASPSAEQVQAAVELRLAFEWVNAGRIRPGATDLLEGLRATGYRLGVVSDCSHELALHWSRLPLAPMVDAVVLSAEEGVRKPHPHMYAAICARLDVDARDCLYVGDGGSQELTGAAAAGMRTVRLSCPDHLAHSTYDSEVLAVTGPTITDLASVTNWVL